MRSVKFKLLNAEATNPNHAAFELYSHQPSRITTTSSSCLSLQG